MSTDLTDLVAGLSNKVNGPGDGGLVTGASTASWTSSLVTGFWEARSHGLFAGYRELDDTVYVVGDEEDEEEMDRVDQQVLITWTAVTVVKAAFSGLATNFEGSAAPGTYVKIQRSAQLVNALLESFLAELEALKTRYADGGSGGSTETHAIDTFISATNAYRDGLSVFLG